MFTSHPNLSDGVNRNVIGSEIEGGVFLDRLQPHSVLQIQTQHRCYTAVMLGGSQALISGHPEYFPEPTLVAIAGSTWGGSMLKRRFVGLVCTWSFVIRNIPRPLSRLASRKSGSVQSVRPSWIGLRSLTDPQYCLKSAQLMKVSAAPRSPPEADERSRGISISGMCSDLLIYLSPSAPVSCDRGSTGLNGAVGAPG